MAKPVIAYPGAKWRFWKFIREYIPRDIKDWREPFLGGASMSLSIADDPEFNLERMIVGDLAPEIWAFWTGIRDNAEEVVGLAREVFKKHCPTHQILKETSETDSNYKNILNKALEEASKFWEHTQNIDCSKLNIVERAARTYLVNKISFSGMGDSGSLSEDRFKEFNLEILDRAILAQPLLQKMEIKNCSFEETLKDIDKDKTFVFLDPPYYKQESSGLYGKNGDTHKGFPHEKFAEVIQNLHCRWFVTYDDSVKVRKMFKDSIITPFKIDGGYTMALKNSEDALAGEELFIYNYEIKNIENHDEAMSLL